MGFESSRVARRRLASLAVTNDLVHEALSPSLFPDLFAEEENDFRIAVTEGGQADVSLRVDRPRSGESALEKVAALPKSQGAKALVRELDELALDIVATPGAGGALLAAYAAQARALTMVLEAADRGLDSPLPAAVLKEARAALRPPSAWAGMSAF